MSSSEILRQTGEILIPAIAYGDAAGLPVETKTARYIAENYGRISQLLPPVDNPFFRGQFEAGTWSDDTQLSLAVSEALIMADGFDLDAQAETHIAEFERTPTVVHKGKVVSSPE
jgi:ADP-ribosylglycohydrolase